MKSLIQALSSSERAKLHVYSCEGREDEEKAMLEDCELVTDKQHLRHTYQIKSL